MKKFAAVLILCLHALLCCGAARHITVIRAAFKGESFQTSRQDCSAKLDSAAAYFNSNYPTNTRFFFDLAPDMELSQEAKYYGANASDRFDALAYKAVLEACLAADPSIDFKACDSNSDGYVDCVIVLFSGISEDRGGGENSIWPHYNLLSNDVAGLTLDGKKINAYCMMCEDAKLGTICHEFGHSLGLPDFYDTDGEQSGGRAKAMWGSLSIMDQGRHNENGSNPPCLNAVERMLLGIGTCLDLNEGKITLPPIRTSGTYIRSGSETECILLECREEGGLLAYYVDRSDSPAGWSDFYKRELTAEERWVRNQINCRPDRQCAAIIPARPGAENMEDIFFPQNDITTFRPQGSDFVLTGIQRNPDGSVSFDIFKPIQISSIQAFQDAVILNWTTESFIHGILKCEISWWPAGKEDESQTSVTKFPGCHTIEGLRSGTEYEIELTITGLDNEIFTSKLCVRTNSMPSNSIPYIHLRTAERNSDGSFRTGTSLPLRICGAEGIAKVDWYMNDEPIGTGADGMWTVNGSGILKAVVWWQDGGNDIFIKELSVR